MEIKKPSADRRRDALSRDRVVAAAIELLDRSGEIGLTFRSLASSLSTGPGAIYWHVSSKSELLMYATETVLSRSLSLDSTDGMPRETIRTVALDIFDAIDEHPWIAQQLSQNSWQSPTMLHFFELIGRQLQRAKVPLEVQFNSATALVTFILGAGSQNAANARTEVASTRTEFFDSVASRWEQLDAHEFPFVRGIVRTLRDHDDRNQFLAGIDIFLTGLGMDHRG